MSGRENRNFICKFVYLCFLDNVFMKKLFLPKFYPLVSLLAVLFLFGCNKAEVTVTPAGDNGKQIVEIVPVEGSINLDEFMDQIVSVEDDVIYFRIAEEAPAVSKTQTKVIIPLLTAGVIVYALESSDLLPHGYLGRITEIVEESKGLVKAVIAKTTISESFDLFKVEGEFAMNVEAGGVSGGFRLHQDDEGYQCISGNIGFSQEHTDGSGEDGDKVTFSVNGTNTTGIKMHLDINQGLLVENPYFRVITDLKFVPNVEFGCSIDGDKDFLRNFVTISGKYVHPSLAILEPSISVGALLKVEGSAGYSIGMSAEQKIRVYVENTDGQWNNRIENLNKNNDEQPDLPGLEFSLSGEAFMGLAFPIALKLCGQDDNSVSITPAVGYNLSGEFKMDLAALDFYDKFKDTKIAGAVQGRVDAVAKLNGKELGKKEETADFLPFEKYIFPHFEQTALIPTSDGVSVSYTATRDLLFPTAVGSAVYTDALIGSRVAESEATDYRYDAKSGFSISATHSGLDYGTYIARPYVKWGPVIVPASPESKFEIKNPEVESVNRAVYYEDGDLDYEYRLFYHYDDEGRVASLSDSLDPEAGGITYYGDRIVVSYGGEVDAQYFLNEEGYLTKIIENGIEKDLTYGSDGYLKRFHYTTVDYDEDGTRTFYEETTDYTYENGNMARYVQNSYTEVTGSPDPERNGIWEVVYTSDFAYSDIENDLSIILLDPAHESVFVTDYGIRFKGITSRCLASSALHTSTDGYYGKATMSYSPEKSGMPKQVKIEYFLRSGERGGYTLYDISYR